MAWEVAKLAIAYILAGLGIVVVGNAIVKLMFRRIQRHFENEAAAIDKKSEEARNTRATLDALLDRLECDLSDVVPCRHEVAK